MGITEIIAAIIGALISSGVTWYIATQAKIRRELSYKVYLMPLISNNIEINNTNIKILYNEKVLDTPCLLCVDVRNTGNKVISDPPIKIYIQEDIDKFPMYIEALPAGYDLLWNLYSEDNFCGINANFINQGEMIKARFLLSSYPCKEVRFSCPMKELNLIDISEEEKKEEEIKGKSGLLDYILEFLKFDEKDD